mmetsp:Transcript_14679/g.31308  ORF Transcript_14679/g.31308 Transcript_14679/m.31308 type:complete len:373 (+) Transcript_14679:104-1222(+)
MGRKKRKVAVAVSNQLPPGADGGGLPIADSRIAAKTSASDTVPPPLPPSSDPRMMRAMTQQQHQQQQQRQGVLLKKSEESTAEDIDTANSDNKKVSSGYATTSHSAEIIDEDIYVSDGSESDEDLMADKLHMGGVEETKPDHGGDDSQNANSNAVNVAGRSIEMVLSGSKMGLMRRGIHRPQQLVQPNRQWARQTQQETSDKNGEGDGTTTNGNDDDDDGNQEDAEERRKRQEEEELAKLDPAQRAARLLAEKQRKLEEAKILARKLESEENAGRDPCLYSKRTSFDIRFDQIEDKPWERTGDITDFFNYGFSEEDWLEYAEQQLLIRQELIDASRQKRPADPSIVPVIPKRPKKTKSARCSGQWKRDRQRR